MDDESNAEEGTWLYKVNVTEEDGGRKASVQLIYGVIHVRIMCQDSSGGRPMSSVERLSGCSELSVN